MLALIHNQQMKISTISDIHVTKEKNYDYLLSFMNHKSVLDSDLIIFLGDIFDLMVGNHQEYIKEFEEFFLQLEKILNDNKKVIFIEGNHDFHLEGLFKFFLEDKNLDKKSFKYIRGGAPLRVKDKSYYFSHGDDIEIGNYFYKIYKLFVRNRFLNYLADKLFTYSFIKDLGRKISDDSRKRNHKYDSATFLRKIKTKYRFSVERFFQNKLKDMDIDFVVCGHSHVEEFYESEKGFFYLNNGFIPNSKKFLHIDDNKPQFLPLV